MLKNHTHKLQKHKYSSGSEIFFCVLDCSFKVEAALALGKTSICHVCGDEFTMTEYSLRLKRPHCVNCSKVKVKDTNGKSHYVRKNSKTQILGTLAEDAASDLSNRLKSLTSIEEDI